MANVQVQQQPQQQPHTHRSSSHSSHTHSSSHTSSHFEHQQAAMSAMQAPLPRHPAAVPHYSTLRRPIPNSYWATPYLLACEYPWAPSTPRPKLDALLAAGVRTFIDLTESGELIGYSQLLPLRASTCGLPASELPTLQYFRFPIPDRSLPPSLTFLSQILSLLARCESQRRVAAVHCRGGIGRTGTVVGCWLVQSGRVSDGEEALEVIAQQWKTVEKHTRFPCSPETGAQAEFVRNFKRLGGAAAAATAGGSGMGMPTSGSTSSIASSTSTTSTTSTASITSATTANTSVASTGSASCPAAPPTSTSTSGNTDQEPAPGEQESKGKES